MTKNGVVKHSFSSTYNVGLSFFLRKRKAQAAEIGDACYSEENLQGELDFPLVVRQRLRDLRG